MSLIKLAVITTQDVMRRRNQRSIEAEFLPEGSRERSQMRNMDYGTSYKFTFEDGTTDEFHSLRTPQDVAYRFNKIHSPRKEFIKALKRNKKSVIGAGIAAAGLTGAGIAAYKHRDKIKKRNW